MWNSETIPGNRQCVYKLDDKKKCVQNSRKIVARSIFSFKLKYSIWLISYNCGLAVSISCPDISAALLKETPMKMYSTTRVRQMPLFLNTLLRSYRYACVQTLCFYVNFLLKISSYLFRLGNATFVTFAKGVPMILIKHIWKDNNSQMYFLIWGKVFKNEASKICGTQ